MMYINEDCPIVYITDDNYVDYTIFSIKSILKVMGKNVDIRIICRDVNGNNRLRLKFSDCISLIDTDGDTIFKLNGRRYLTNTVFLKFEIPNLIGTDKCVYMDGDTIIINDITELLNTDVNDCMLAAVKDFGETYVWKPYANLQCGQTVNAGVMVLNLKMIRESDGITNLYKTKEKLGGCDIVDQEVINTVFADNIKYLSIRYNVSLDKIKSGDHKEYGDVRLYNKLYGTKYNTVDDLINDSAIFHFHGNKKQIYSKPYVKRILETVECGGDVERLISNMDSYKKLNPYFFGSSFGR